MNTRIVDAFDEIRQGYSVDRVMVDPSLRLNFVAACRSRGLMAGEPELFKGLLNLRKMGLLSSRKSLRTRFDDQDYRFAAEIALRHLQRKTTLSLDELFALPESLEEFDQVCMELAPGFSSLQYRWAALSLRKARSATPEIIGRAIPSEQVLLLNCGTIEIASIPALQGLYVFISPKEVLYVGEAGNLRIRLRKHLDHSDNRHLARHFWEFGLDKIKLEVHVLPKDLNTRTRRALELELIHSRRPTFNFPGS